MNSEDQKKKLLENIDKLNDEKKIKLMEKSYRVLRKVAVDQIEKLKKRRYLYPSSFKYFYTLFVVEYFWELGDFVLTLGKTRIIPFRKYCQHAILPTRTMMEIMLKLVYFSKLTNQEQEKIGKKEFLINCLNYYELELSRKNKTGAESYAKYYSKLNNGEFSEIGDAKRLEIKSFPQIEELCDLSDLEGKEALYSFYRIICGPVHGDAFHAFQVRKGVDKSELVRDYKQAIMYTVRFCIETLKAIDIVLGNETKTQVNDVINKVYDLGVKAR